MNVHYSKELPQAFVIGSSELRGVVGLLEEHVGEVDIRVECSDDFSRYFETVEKLISYRNPKAKEIRRIYLTTRSDDYTKSASITFVDSTWSGILIDYKGPEDTVFRLKEETLDIIAGIRPWYTVMSYINFIFIAALIFGFVNGVWTSPYILRKVSEFRGAPIPDNFEKETNLSTFLYELLYITPINLILAAIFFSLCWPFLKKLHKFLFPQSVFTIGQGKLRFKHQQKVLWGVIITFIVSLAAGVFVLILQLILK